MQANTDVGTNTSEWKNLRGKLCEELEYNLIFADSLYLRTISERDAISLLDIFKGFLTKVGLQPGSFTLEMLSVLLDIDVSDILLMVSIWVKWNLVKKSGERYIFIEQ